MEAPSPLPRDLALAQDRLTLPLDHVTLLATEPDAVVTLSGQVTTSFDGSSFDAASLFDITAGGLRIVKTDPVHHAYIVAPTGEYAPACAVVGGVPCLVPRLTVLAHDRLHTASELASTLSGSIALESHPAPSAAPAILSALSLMVLGLVGVASLAWLVVAWSKRAARTALGRIRIAARQALRAARGDATLEGARRQIRVLVDRARHVDRIRRAYARRLARIDWDALERRQETCARATVPLAEAALASFSAERAAADQLESDHRSAVVELERIQSVLRTAALRVGRTQSPPGMRFRASSPAAFADPVDALVSELDLRDESIAEADAT
jgi:hypothetical protein